MGCCVSTHEKNHSFEDNIHQSPPRVEEEAVKEVLTEIQKPKPKPRPISRPESPRKQSLEEDIGDHTKAKLLLLTPKKAYLDPNLPTRDPDPYTPGNIGMYRSQGYNGNYSPNKYHYSDGNGLKNQGRSPVRKRPEGSPTRKRNQSPGGSRREMGGDNVDRRSQSPGMRGNVGRSPSGRRNGPSPGRVRMVHGPRMEEEEIGYEELRRQSEEWQGPKESLENPLVSLECFIFL
ncbi:uncharacterized protein LOC130823477 [Amaranthus tricolor]|uniref:uncharacterized protein LOC130823477 n=1 Tax=Amaranthus tricolor TaxID=29722 RepID=UPI00258C99F2|nr:uncharacterized protein LOC130823477 [Amaranthus tricolor]